MAKRPAGIVGAGEVTHARGPVGRVADPGRKSVRLPSARRPSGATPARMSEWQPIRPAAVRVPQPATRPASGKHCPAFVASDLPVTASRPGGGGGPDARPRSRRVDGIVYTEQCEVSCICPESGTGGAHDVPGGAKRTATSSSTEVQGRPGARSARAARAVTAAPAARPVGAALHADPARQPVVAAGLPAPRRPQAHLRPDRPRLRSGAARRARPGPHADAHRAEHGRRDGGRAASSRTAPRPGRTRHGDTRSATGGRPRHLRPPSGAGAVMPQPGGARSPVAGRSIRRNGHRTQVSCCHDSLVI